MNNKKLHIHKKAGFTITEALVSSLLVVSASVIIYTGASVHYRMIRKAALLEETQNLAYREIWRQYALPFSSLQDETFPMSSNSLLGTNGTIQVTILPDAADKNHKLIVCQVWAPPVYGYGNKMRNNSTLLVDYRLDCYNSEAN